MVRTGLGLVFSFVYVPVGGAGGFPLLPELIFSGMARRSHPEGAGGETRSVLTASSHAATGLP